MINSLIRYLGAKMNISVFLMVYSAVSLIFAYTSQYAFGLAPCMLCLYQRLPFFAVLILGIISVFVKSRLRLAVIALCGVILLTGSGIAFFHVGVEEGIFKMETECGDAMAEASTIEEMTTQLLGKTYVPCDKPQFVFMGISMAGWNFLFSSAFGLISLFITFRIYNNFRLADKSDAYQKSKGK